MRRVDPSITLIASGKMLENTFLRGEMRATHVGDLQPLYGSDVDWTGGLLAHCWGNFDGIAEHWYAQPNRRFDLERARGLPPDAPTDDAWVKVDMTQLEWARYAGDVIKRKAEEWNGYQQRFPAMRDKKTFLSIDEYAYFGGGRGGGPTLKLALAYGMLFNEMLRHIDFLTMSAHTMGVSTLDYNSTGAVLNTTGLLFKMYGDHFFGSIPVAVSGNSPQPAFKTPLGGDQPTTSSGSPTYPLDIFAAITPDHKYLNLAVVNALDSVQNFELKVTGSRVNGASKLWQLRGDSVDAANHVGQPAAVEIKETAIADVPQTVSVAPISVSVYRFPIAQAQ